MGNLISKCCGKADRKYKKNKEIKQPKQEEEEVKIATNAGGVKDTPFVNKPDETQVRLNMDNESSVPTLDQFKQGVHSSPPFFK
jgi:hypothetical protein